MTSTASARVSTPTTSIPSTSLASATAAAATTTRRRPRRARTETIGRTPGTARTSPPSDSSPISATRPGPARTCSDPSRMPTAIARSSEAPALRRSAGARLTVIRRGGWTNPALRNAPRTRSRASCSAVSARPTMVKPGQPRGDVDLDPDEPAVEAVERGGRNDGQHRPRLRTGAHRRLTRALDGAPPGGAQGSSI